MIKNKTSLDAFAKLLENPSPNLSVEVYTDDVKVIKEPGVKKRSNNKMTLTKLAQEMRDGFKQVNTRIDDLEKRIDGIDARIDQIDARLDYNGLKKLPIDNKKI